MIYVTVGTAHKPFVSLLSTIDEFNKTHHKEIIAQIGHSTYVPRYYRWFRFCSPQEMQDYIQEAELIVSHGGLAIIGECLRRGKPLIVVPRNPEEAVNPQNELVEFLCQEGYLAAVSAGEELLPYLLGEIHPPQRRFDFKSATPELVAQFVSEILNQ